MIRFVCDCGRQLQAREDDVGKKVRCPACDAVTTVPADTSRRGSEGIREEPNDREDDRPSRRRRDDRDDYDDHDSPQQSSGKATASLVLGIISFCFAPLSIVGIILGAMALSQIKNSRGRIGGRGTAIAGIVTSCISLMLMISFFALVLPAVAKVREAAARMQDSNNLKQIGLAMHSFHDVNNGLPQSAAYYTKDGKPGLSWRVALLPYIEQDNLFKQFNLDEAWDSPHNKPLLARIPKTYLMPGQLPDGSGMTHYQIFVGKGTMFEEMPARRPIQPGVPVLGMRIMEMPDGSSNTIMVAAGRSPVLWTKPDDLVFDPVGPPPVLSDRYAGGSNILFGDGSTHFLPPRTSEQQLKAMITRNGGEMIER